MSITASDPIRSEMERRAAWQERVRKAFRAEIARRELLQSDVARKCGYSQSALSRRLTGETELTERDIRVIAEAIGIEPADLADGQI